MKNVLLAFLLFSTFSCQAQSASNSVIDAGAFEEAIKDSSIQLLDVRTADEFKSGHIAHALQADWTRKEEFMDRIAYVDKNRPVYIYCLVGGRSAAAATWMRNNGYLNVVELQGGINAWKRENKPVVGNSDEAQLTYEEYMDSIPKDKTTLVDIGATWCPPCVKMEPVINALLSDKQVDFALIKINAGSQTNLLQALNVAPIPVFIVYKNGKEVWRKQGVITKEALIEKLR